MYCINRNCCYHEYKNECGCSIISDISKCEECFTGVDISTTKNFGIKNDDNKNRWDLLPWKQIELIVEILTFGAQKYSDENWKKVDNHRQRYFAATMRHLTAWFRGEKNDPESGKSHLAHAVCCLLFLMWFDDESK